MTCYYVHIHRQSLATDCPPSMFNPETGLLEAPMTIRVADQVTQENQAISWQSFKNVKRL